MPAATNLALIALHRSQTCPVAAWIINRPRTKARGRARATVTQPAGQLLAGQHRLGAAAAASCRRMDEAERALVGIPPQLLRVGVRRDRGRPRPIWDRREHRQGAERGVFAPRLSHRDTLQKLPDSHRLVGWYHPVTFDP